MYLIAGQKTARMKRCGPDLRHADKLAHEVRLITLQFGKFVDHDKKMGNWGSRLTALHHFGILVDMIYATFTNVSDRWAKNRTYETMRVPIGQKAGGGTLELDIHENARL